MSTQLTFNQGQLVQTGDYFQYVVVQDKVDTVIVTPDQGHFTQWGEHQALEYEYSKDSLYPV
jgi:hypothetical protein